MLTPEQFSKKVDKLYNGKEVNSVIKKAIDKDLRDIQNEISGYQTKNNSLASIKNTKPTNIAAYTLVKDTTELYKLQYISNVLIILGIFLLCYFSFKKI